MKDTIIIPKSRYKELLAYEAVVKGVERTADEKLDTLHEMVKLIVGSSRTWKEKSTILFSPEVYGRIKKFAPDFNPKLTKLCDATDVMIFACEFDRYMLNR